MALLGSKRVGRKLANARVDRKLANARARFLAVVLRILAVKGSPSLDFAAER